MSPLVNQEVVPAGEADATQAIAASIETTVKAAAKAGQHPVRRDAHAKGHGCVRSTFDIAPNIPASLRIGVFAERRSYSAWIRFSNGNGTPHDDHAGDGRGMAVKLMGVAGTKALEEEAAATTQDFVMINYPAFFVKNASDYLEFSQLSAINKANVFFASHTREAAVSKAITTMAVDQVFQQRYYSMTPYLLGDQYIKFSAIPVDCSTRMRISVAGESQPGRSPDFLRAAMVAWLQNKDACFNFAVQPQTDAATMPIEDPTIIWDETIAPFITVATIRIPRQTFDTPERQSFCENLSYTPWHSLAVQRPVGGINRIRKVVYQSISELRHQLNSAPRIEPAGNETF